ncbi:MAG: TnsA endonuclease N-terminal domain-containing protein [Ghiorsea sp.]
MNWADRCPSVIAVASEEVVIPYISPLDNKVHRYYLDFYIKVKTSDGDIAEKIIEVKPKKECTVPRQKKNEARYIKECKTYCVNQAKWKAARAWAAERNMKFEIITEYELGIKKRRKRRSTADKII